MCAIIHKRISVITTLINMQWIIPYIITLLGLADSHEISYKRAKMIPEESYNLKRENCLTSEKRSTLLSGVRNLFEKHKIDAYLITDNDVHMNLNVPGHDARIRALSGFYKNFGIAVITSTEAALWTDGRHFREAEYETDCGWEIYRKGGPEVVSVTEWIIDKLQNKDGTKIIGSCPSYMNAVWWKNFNTVLSASQVDLIPIENDLVDEAWTLGRPMRPSSDINALDIKFAGRSWQEKVMDVRKEMKTKNADVLVVTAVDEIAWLFNARAKDFPFIPYFYSLAIIEQDSVSLYIADSRSKLSRVPSDPETRQKLKDHLNTQSDGICTTNCVQVKEYNHKRFVEDVSSATKRSKGKIWVSFDCNYKLYSIIPESRVYQAVPPTSYLKAKKNFVERNGMRSSNLLDSVEMIEFFARLEKEIAEGKSWTVHSAAEEAINVRSRSLSLYRDQSFNTLSGSGHLGANFRYHPSEENDHFITDHEIFNQDSGGQYLDGTSDLTRTFHYGRPNAREKEMYTRVLKAVINLSNLKFPVGQSGRSIDSVSRQPLWEIGVDYAHETGHGISHNGAVVEGPARISCVEETHTSDVKLERSLWNYEESLLGRVPDWADYPIDEHMCFTSEPGFYDENCFGIRLENVMIVRKSVMQENTSSHNFLEFETVTLIPFEPHLFELDLLDQDEVDWLNKYHQEVWNRVSPLLKKKNNTVALDWVYKRIQPVSLHYSIHSETESRRNKGEL